MSAAERQGGSGCEIWLMRHAKAESDGPWRDDHDRPLAPRGQRAAALIAATIAQWKLLPEQILCSTAVRARQTLEHMAPALDEVPVLYERDLYLVSAGRLLERLREIAEPRTVMVIAHSPGLDELALELANPATSRHGILLSRLERGFPTAALCRLVAPIEDWSQLALRSARVIDFAMPKSLI